jgi:negative regulator of genetic competence, sporulation and motility
MKMQYAVAASLLLSLSAFAQKEELKALKKLDDQKTPITDAQVQEYNTLFSAFESKMGAATEEQKRDFYYYRGTYYLVVDIEKNPANVMNAVNKGMEDINKLLEIEKNGKKKYTEEIQTQLLPQMKMEL